MCVSLSIQFSHETFKIALINVSGLQTNNAMLCMFKAYDFEVLAICCLFPPLLNFGLAMLLEIYDDCYCSKKEERRGALLRGSSSSLLSCKSPTIVSMMIAHLAEATILPTNDKLYPLTLTLSQKCFFKSKITLQQTHQPLDGV